MNEPIIAVLRRLREEAHTQSAPDALESKLVSAFREHHSGHRRANLKWLFVPAAVAASLLIALAWRYVWQAPPGLEPVAIAPAPVERKAFSSTPKPVAKTNPPRRRAPRGLQTAWTPKSQAKEFIRIPYTPAFGPDDSGQIVRMSMPGASVRTLGLPVALDSVQADVLLGNDGIARAIRLVSSSGLNSTR
jgi:hypothetical protein